MPVFPSVRRGMLPEGIFVPDRAEQPEMVRAAEAALRKKERRFIFILISCASRLK